MKVQCFKIGRNDVFEQVCAWDENYPRQSSMHRGVDESHIVFLGVHCFAVESCGIIAQHSNSALFMC